MFYCIIADTRLICVHVVSSCDDDCQKMIKLWLSLETNHGVSVLLSNMSLSLWCAGVEHINGRRP
jgi:hypothetical protein